MMTREICKICYQINRVGFDVPETIWKQAIPIQFQNHVVCLNCFTRLADEQMLHWDKQIKFYPVSMATHLDRMGV